MIHIYEHPNLSLFLGNDSVSNLDAKLLWLPFVAIVLSYFGFSMASSLLYFVSIFVSMLT